MEIEEVDVIAGIQYQIVRDSLVQFIQLIACWRKRELKAAVVQSRYDNQIAGRVSVLRFIGYEEDIALIMGQRLPLILLFVEGQDIQLGAVLVERVDRNHSFFRDGGVVLQ